MALVVMDRETPSPTSWNHRVKIRDDIHYHTRAPRYSAQKTSLRLWIWNHHHVISGVGWKKKEKSLGLAYSGWDSVGFVGVYRWLNQIRKSFLLFLVIIRLLACLLLLNTLDATSSNCIEYRSRFLFSVFFLQLWIVVCLLCQSVLTWFFIPPGSFFSTGELCVWYRRICQRPRDIGSRALFKK